MSDLPTGGSSDRPQFARWLVLSALSAIAALAYAAALGAECWLIDPDSIGTGLTAAERWQRAAISAAIAAALLGPGMGFAILRQTNTSAQTPADETRWWSRAHRITLHTMIAVALAGHAFGALVAAAAWWRGGDPRAWFCWALAWSSVLTAFGLTLRTATVLGEDA